MVLDLVIDIGVLVLLVAGISLCVMLMVVLLKFVPPLLRSARNLDKISGDAAAVSGDVANDIATATRNAAAASENVVDASQDIATAASALAAIGQFNVPAILAQVASGQIGNVRQLAGFIGNNWPDAASRVGRFFRRS